MKRIKLKDSKYLVVDDIDYDWVCDVGLYRSGQYVMCNIDKQLKSLHRVLLEKKLGRRLHKGEETDHINRNSLDNRRSNLRVCSAQENKQNRGVHKNNKSGYKGVCWHKYKQKWHSQICVNNQRIHLGYYDDIIEAYESYKIGAIKYHGEFASVGS